MDEEGDKKGKDVRLKEDKDKKLVKGKVKRKRNLWKKVVIKRRSCHCIISHSNVTYRLM